MEETVTTLEDRDVWLQGSSPCSRRRPQKRQEHVGEQEGSKVVRRKLQLVPFRAPGEETDQHWEPQLS